MYYPNSPYCPNCDKNNCGSDGGNNGNNGSNGNNGNNENNGNGGTNLSQSALLRKIREIEFAAYDIQLFLDTHPYDDQALDLFTQLSATAKSLEQDYEHTYGPLMAGASPNETPFVWVADDYNWPWVKEGDN